MSSLSQRRLTINEALQRLDNDSAHRTLLDIMNSDDIVQFRCECSKRTCNEHIALTNRQFLEFHRTGKHFVVRPHHERLKKERTVFSTENYRIVEKFVDQRLTKI